MTLQQHCMHLPLISIFVYLPYRLVQLLGKRWIHSGPLHTCWFQWNNKTWVRIQSNMWEWHSCLLCVCTTTSMNSSIRKKSFLPHKKSKFLTYQFLGNCNENKWEKVETGADYECWDRVVDKAFVILGWYEGRFQSVGKLKEPIRDLKQSNKPPVSLFVSFWLSNCFYLLWQSLLTAT